MRAFLCVAALGLVSVGAARAAWFTDVTDGSGIDFVTTSGRSPSTEILEVNGSGLALFDYDGDGDLDLFVANGATMDDPEHGPGSRLYSNRGNGTFVDVTAAVGLTLRRWAMGVAVGDYDGDGDDDLYVTCYGANALLRNDVRGGERRLVDVAAEAGVADARWGTSAAFTDIDGDGDLDLYVANYLAFDPAHPPPRGARTFQGVEVFAGPRGLPAEADVLYENLGDGRFRDATAAFGAVPAKPGYGLGVVAFDYDGDGRQDLLVGNDSTENFLFHGLGGGKLEEVGLVSGVSADFDGRTQATMGIAVADVDGNGLGDLFTTNFAGDTNTLHLNLDRGQFEDRTSQFGLAAVSRPYLSWGAGFYDFDCDGDEDLLVASGHIYPEAATGALDADYEQPLLLFERDGERFRLHTGDEPVLSRRYAGRALAFGDLDDDGDVDVVLSSLGDRVRVLRNDAPRRDVVVIEPRGRPGNPHGLGALVELASGGRVQRRWLDGGSYLSVDEPAAWFGGVGGDGASLTVRVRWADGTRCERQRLPPNRRITITEGEDGFRARPFRGREAP